MLIRQRILLYLILKADGKATRLSLTKWAFLLVQRNKSLPLDTFYQFLPYKYGPYSFGLYYELDALIRNGYVRETANKLKVTQPDFLRPEREIELALDNLIGDVGTLSVNNLLEMVYDTYHWFTVNASKREQRRMSRPKADLAVYTIGYERLQIDGFLNIILQNGICRLIDIRRNPISRRYGFHKSTLQHLCSKLGVKYEHIPELGVISEWRQDLQTNNDYIELFRKYRQQIQSDQSHLIQIVDDWMRDSPSALMCMEADPVMCHRSQLAEIISERSGLKIVELRTKKCKTSNLFEQEFLLPS